MKKEEAPFKQENPRPRRVSKRVEKLVDHILQKSYARFTADVITRRAVRQMLGRPLPAR